MLVQKHTPPRVTRVSLPKLQEMFESAEADLEEASITLELHAADSAKQFAMMRKDLQCVRKDLARLRTLFFPPQKKARTRR